MKITKKNRKQNSKRIFFLSQKFERKVKVWIDKWQGNKTLSNDWIKFIKPENSKPSKVYGNIKSHKIKNPARLITSSCSRTVESCSCL